MKSKKQLLVLFSVLYTVCEVTSGCTIIPPDKATEIEVNCAKPVCAKEPQIKVNPELKINESSLEVEVTYKNSKEAEVIIMWSYNTKQPNLGFIYINVSYDWKDYHVKGCQYKIPASVQVIKQIIDITKSKLIRKYECISRIPLVDHISFTITDGVQTLKRDVLIPDCWNVTRNRSLCGGRIPSEPVNLAATAMMLPSGNVTVTVRWDPPLYNNTPLHGYHIKAVLEGIHTNKRLYMRDCYNGTTSTFKVAANPENRIFVKVAAIIEITDLLGGTYSPQCYTPVQCNNYKGGQSNMVYVTWVHHKENFKNFPHRIVWPAISVAIILLVSLVVLFACMLKRYREKTKRMKHLRLSVETLVNVPETHTERLPDLPDTPPPKPKSVFIVASTLDNELNRLRARNICTCLGLGNIETSYYEYNGSITTSWLSWANGCFNKCNYVVFLLTNQFVCDWEGMYADQDKEVCPLVSSVHHLLDGVLPNKQEMSRFAVLLMGEDCQVPIDLKRMQKFQVFSDCDSNCKTDELERYLLQAPPYAPPRVRH